MASSSRSKMRAGPLWVFRSPPAIFTTHPSGASEPLRMTRLPIGLTGLSSGRTTSWPGVSVARAASSANVRPETVIASLCAMEHGIKIAGVVQKGAAKAQFIGLPVFDNFDTVTGEFDAVLITDVLEPRGTCEAAVARFGVDLVLVPELLRIRMRQNGGDEK